ncbi:MAG: hypothetical protein VYA69_04800 [Gemmatimonadota bacterium]|nr:hypothetical protein [Gemmatimonadota bacterium]
MLYRFVDADLGRRQIPINKQVEGNVTILEFKEILKGGDETVIFHEKLASLRQDQLANVVADVNDPTPITKAGVGVSWMQVPKESV